MGRRNLYVGVGHEPVWEVAEAIAKREGVSVSEMTGQALLHYIKPLCSPEELRHLAGEGGDSIQTVDGRLKRMQQQINELARHTGLDRIMSGFDE